MFSLPHNKDLKASRDLFLETVPRSTQVLAFEVLENVLTPEDAEQLRAWFRFCGWDWIEANSIDRLWGRQVAATLKAVLKDEPLPNDYSWDEFYVPVLEVAVGIRPDFREEEGYDPDNPNGGRESEPDAIETQQSLVDTDGPEESGHGEHREEPQVSEGDNPEQRGDTLYTERDLSAHDERGDNELTGLVPKPRRGRTPKGTLDF